MNMRKLSINKACVLLGTLLLLAVGAVCTAVYLLTQNITAVRCVFLFSLFVLLCVICFVALIRRKLVRFSDTVTPVLGEKAAHNGKVVYSLDFEVTPHQLRHTYITNLIHSSVDPKTVQYLAGHESSKITMDIYAKVKYNRPDELVKSMGGAFAQWDGVRS